MGLSEYERELIEHGAPGTPEACRVMVVRLLQAILVRLVLNEESGAKPPQNS